MGRHRRPPNPQDRTEGAAPVPPSPVPPSPEVRHREAPARKAPRPAPPGEGPAFRQPLPAAEPEARGPHPEADEPARPGPEEGPLGAGERAEPGGGGPRPEYVEAFDRPFGSAAGAAASRTAGTSARADTAQARTDDGSDVDLFAPRSRTAQAADPRAREPRPASARPAAPPPRAPSPGEGREESGEGRGESGEGRGESGPAASRAGGGHKGRLLAGACAAALTLGLAVVVSGQHHEGGVAPLDAKAHAASPSVDSRRSVPSEDPSPSAPPTYDELMGRTYPLAADAEGPGTFTTVPGSARAPHAVTAAQSRAGGRLYSYRVDIEDGLKLDGQLFADAVQKTLNDDRSWVHGGQRAFQRISEGQPDFVVTLASPGTTDVWCAKSGLDTSVDNVSCDSASTPRVMINAYRWAQGSTTYGDAIHPYRQMLINHEVGHRLGHNHESCTRDGQLAPVMQQQTKFLDHDGITCLPNPWPFPRS